MLSRRWLALFSIFTLSACSLVGGESIDQKVEKSTVLITYGNKGGNGSGFFIQGPKEICALLTASHVLASDNLKIRTHDLKSWPAANTQQIPNLDMAVVTFKPEGNECPYKPLKFGDSNQVKRLDKIYVAGFPASEGRTDLIFQFISGQVTATPPPIVDGYAISYSAQTSGGTSGGPVVNEAGLVVAVHGLTDVEVRTLRNLREGNVSGEETRASGTQVSNAGLKWGIPIDRFPKEFKISTQPDVLSNVKKWLNFGNGSYVREDYESALAAYEEAIKIKDDHPESWWNKGTAQNALKKHEDAIKSYERAIKLKPDYAFAYNDLGVALNSVEKHKEAFESYDKATQIQPDYALAWYNRGLTALHDLKNYQEAVDSFEKAIKFKTSYVATAWYNRGSALFELNNYLEALESFEKAVQLDSDYKSVFRDKGFNLLWSDQYKEALAFYEKATEIEPDSKNAWDRKCSTLNKLKRYAAALEACNQSNVIDNSNCDTWDERGIALENLQQYQAALESYEKALEINPKYSWSIKGRERMMSKLGL